MKRYNRLGSLAIAIMGLALATGCSDSGDSTPTGNNNGPVLRAVWRGNEGIGQLLAQKCTPCHTSQNQAGFTVTSYALATQANGPIVPGDSTASRIVKRLQGDPNFGGQMPQGGPFLPRADIDTIKAWIQAGALDN